MKWKIIFRFKLRIFLNDGKYIIALDKNCLNPEKYCYKYIPLSEKNNIEWLGLSLKVVYYTWLQESEVTSNN